MSLAQLFGGAITCAIPGEFDDISSVRQVPDNQEVYVHRSGDVSIIVEILEMVHTIPDPAQAVLVCSAARTASALDSFVVSLAGHCRDEQRY